MADTDPYTAQLSPGTRTSVTAQYFDLNQPFALPRSGNECTSYVCGRDYMNDVAAAIRAAKHFIFIADWQLDYDVELDKRGQPGHPGRLSELIVDALARGVHIRVLCYDSIRFAADTHDDTTQSILEGLPDGKGSIQVMLQNPNTSRDSVLWAGAKRLFTGKEMDPNINFSHHQKFVVVDGYLAFVGGIDLAYGRWETPAFEVVLDPNIHIINDGYNMQVSPSREMTQHEKSLTEEKSDRPGFSTSKYPDQKLLNPTQQPRQPWNDVAVRIKGPAAFDVFVNFVLRWNSFAKQLLSTNIFDRQLSVNWFERDAKGHETLTDPLKPGNGTATVQICRSASSTQLADELTIWDQGRKYVQDDWKQPNPKREKVMRDARRMWAGSHQTSIRDAMVNCIRSAQAYIYIENQFFISDCGLDRHGNRAPATNQIVSELANAIGRAIHAERPFHVWLVLPEHPEGMLEDKPTATQAWWALQGIKHGQNSLINRINATILEKNKRAWSVTKPIRTNDDVEAVLKTHGMEHGWRNYLTVLNMRNYGQTSEGVVTEMIYVHSKLTIIDDAVAIIGSANINDRSLSGNGDTELAAVIADSSEAAWTDLGQGVKGPTRKFARELRVKLWKKHFGMLIDTPTSGVQKEDAPPFGIDIDRPIAKSSITGIQKLSAQNRSAYNRVFLHTPRNEFGELVSGRKAYPPKTRREKSYEINGTPIGEYGPDGSRRAPYVWVDKPTEKRDFSKMPPLQPAFMIAGRHDISRAIKELRASVKGFLVEMPLDWGAKQASTPKPPIGMSQLIAERDRVEEREGSFENG
ncbi:phospholipase D-like domain-containing protein [Niveibacterium sp.]|uniref:phospholipase D-like domain-containing protein n=1 Tax=Niveibacterium sp. TaxID=2017444 RepID=UPI0035B3E219